MSDEGELEQLETALAAQEALRGTVADAVIDTTVAALRQQIDLARRRAQPKRRRLATVLFADISGSTELGETIDAEELSDRFDALWQKLDRIIERHGGTIDKHIGDAVMALWGVDGSSENDPERAIRAGLAMLDALEGLRAHDVLPGTAMRIGINTGPVVFGAIAGTSEATAMGDTVNVAARLESAAPLGSVLIGQDTYQHVRGIFSVGLREPLSVKGKRQPLRTYLVESVRPRAFRLHARQIAGVETPMVARDDEFASLQAALDRTIADGRPEFVYVTGPAGMGKSRLLFEFEDWLRARDGEVRRFSGRGDTEHQSTPYGVLRDIVFDRFEITEDEATPIARAKLEVGVREIAGADMSDEVGVIAHLIGLADAPTDTPIEVEGAAAAVARLLVATAERMPVVLLLEDLHWADPATTRLLRALGTELSDGSVLVVGAGRTDERADVALPEPTVRIELGPLADADIQRLLTGLLDRADEIPPVLVERVTAAAGGNPFYVEELVRMFLDEGAVEVADDGWRFDVARLEEIRVPSTLRGVLQARLDQLQPREFSLLQRAAVVGPAFWTSAIPTIGAGDLAGGESAETIAALASKGLLQRVPVSDFAGDDEHRFAHALLHEVVYESVLLGERAEMHAQVAHWMSIRAESAADTIAGHYRAAGRLDDAARWFATAAKRARDRYAADEGIAAATAAIAERWLDPRARAACLDDLIECMSIAARYDEALDLTDQLETIGEDLDDAAIRGLARSFRSHLLIRLGRSRDALAAAKSAVDVVAALPPDAAAAIDALTELGWVLVRLGRAEEAVAHARHALERLGASPDVSLRRRAVSLAGVASLAAGDFAGAEHHLLVGLDLSRLHGHRRSEAGCLINLSEIARQRGDLDRSVRLGREALDLVRAIRDRDQEALVLSNLGGGLVEQGNADEALPLLVAAIEAFTRTGASEHTSETHRFLAEAHLARGDIDAAWNEIAIAHELATVDENPDHLGHAWRVAGLTCAVTDSSWRTDAGSFDAVACLRTAEGLFADADLRRDRAVTLLRLAELVAEPEREALRDEGHALLEAMDLPLLVDRAMTSPS